MTINWPEAAIVIVLLMIVGAFVLGKSHTAAEIAREAAKGKNGDQYRILAADYEKLARETHDATLAMQSDLAAMLARVDSIERMMRDVA
jgi:hypothetical protein